MNGIAVQFLLKFLALNIFLVLSSCSSMKNGGVSCLSESEVSFKKKKYVENFKDMFPKEFLKGAYWTLVEDQCSKKYFKYGEQIHILIYRDPVSNHVNGMYRNAPYTKSPEGCLEKAVEDINSLDLNWSDYLLKIAKNKLGARWEDDMIGPSSFLSCENQSKKNNDYMSSLALFVHEISHIASKYCLQNVKTKKGNCFFNTTKYDLDDLKLGVRSALKRKSDKVKVPKSFIRTQDKYLSISEKELRPVRLLDELQAYTIDLELIHKFNTKYGKPNSRKYPSAIPFLALYDLVKRMKVQITSIDPAYAKKKISKETDYYLTEAQKAADLYYKSCAADSRIVKCRDYSLWRALR